MRYLKTAIGKVNAAMLAFFVLLASVSCTKIEKPDVSGLIGTVPSSASGVIGLNVTSMLSKSGFKVENGVVVPGKDTQVDISALSGRSLEFARIFFTGDSGVDPSGAIIFYDSNRCYMTFGLSDIVKFEEFVKKNNQGEFIQKSGVSVCGNVAVKGAQAWVLLTSNEIDPDTVIGYTMLSETQSFMQNPYGKKIAEMDHDFTGWCKMALISRNIMSFQQVTIFNLLSSSLFEGADEVMFEGDFEKGRFEAELKVLDKKGKPAKYLLPAEKIDVATVKQVGAKTDVLVAANVSANLFGKLDKIGKTLGTDHYNNFKEMIKNLDGTLAVGMSNPDELDQNFSGVVTTDGHPSLILKGAISTLAPIREDGNLIKFSKGTMNGELEVAKCADLLKGSTIGVITDFPAYPISELSALPFINSSFDSFSLYCLKLEPEGNSVNLELIIEANDASQNILKTILGKK